MSPPSLRRSQSRNEVSEMTARTVSSYHKVARRGIIFKTCDMMKSVEFVSYVCFGESKPKSIEDVCGSAQPWWVLNSSGCVWIRHAHAAVASRQSSCWRVEGNVADGPRSRILGAHAVLKNVAIHLSRSTWLKIAMIVVVIEVWTHVGEASGGDTSTGYTKRGKQSGLRDLNTLQRETYVYKWATTSIEVYSYLFTRTKTTGFEYCKKAI